MIERQREAEGIRAVGEAEAEAIRLKALAEAEGIDKKAEAMKKYGEAAVIEMIMAALPEIAKNVAEPLSKVDKITMYGEGNSAKLLSDIVNGTTQVTEGISAGMGIASWRLTQHPLRLWFRPRPKLQKMSPPSRMKNLPKYKY